MLSIPERYWYYVFRDLSGVTVSNSISNQREDGKMFLILQNFKQCFTQWKFKTSVHQDKVTHYELPHPKLHCMQINFFFPFWGLKY